MHPKYFSIGWKIGAHVFSITILLAMIVVAANFLFDYRSEMDRVERYRHEIEKSHLPVLTSNLWNLHFSQIKLHLEGMLSISHIAYIELNNYGEKFAYGNDRERPTLDYAFPLVRAKVGPIGQLEIRFSKASVRSAALDQLRIIFFPVLLHTLIVSVLIILVFYFNVTRHLTALGNYTKTLTTDNMGTRFRFDRKPTQSTYDELDQLLESIDQMRLNIIEQLRQQKTMEQQLLRTQKMESLGTLAGGVAHDLNNILSGIVSYPDLLMMDFPEGSRMKASLMTIKQSGLKASAIVQDLLTLARRAVPAMEVTNLNRITADYLESPEFQKLQQYHPDISVESRLTATGLHITGSPVHLSKALMNLVSNAAEAIDGPGTVKVSTGHHHVDAGSDRLLDLKPGDYAVLSVTDTGVGMTAAEMERIFEPFYTKKVMGRSGTGLGMAVVYGTVKDHDGHIDIQSRPGEGTEITVFFPATPSEPRAAAEKPPLLFTANGESILIVDDVPEQRKIAGDILKKLGYVVDDVPSGEAAVAFLKKQRVDLVVLDMILAPGMDGLDTFKAIRNIHPRQKAIIVSGYSESDRVKGALRLGAGRYIRKPYLIETIGETVRKELDAGGGLSTFDASQSRCG